jgi:hypothetical protein
MKLLNTFASIAVGTYVVLMLGACGKTSNGSGDAPAATPASTCTRSWDGTLRDQYGRTCNNYANSAGSCTNARYNPQTGQYVDINTGYPVQCNPQGYFDGYNSVPYNGSYQGQTFQGCQGWSQIYGAQYIPVDIGNGQLVCMNYAYLGQAYPQVYQYPPTYYYSQPVYTCSGYDCGGGSYYGGGGCQSSVNVGFSYGGVSAGIGFCN